MANWLVSATVTREYEFDVKAESYEKALEKAKAFQPEWDDWSTAYKPEVKVDLLVYDDSND